MVLRGCVSMPQLYPGNIGQPTYDLTADNDYDIGLYKHTSTSWVRIWADWLHMQPQGPGQIDPGLLAALDANVAAAKNAGLGVILVSRSYPLWANGTANLVENNGVLPNGESWDTAPWIGGSPPPCAFALDSDRPRISSNPMPVEELSMRFPISAGAVCTGGAQGGAPLSYNWDVGVGSAWYNWILFLATRYNPNVAIRTAALTYSSLASLGGLPTLPSNASINLLEFVNEPLGTEGWPQHGADGTLSTGSVAAVSGMFHSAQQIVDGVLAGKTGLLMAGPASEDKRIAPAGYSTTQDFTYVLLQELKSSGFNLKDSNFVWTHHFYDDFTRMRTLAPSNKELSGPTPIKVRKGVNSAALVRAMLAKAGWTGYRHPGRDGSTPRLWLTEGGVDLAKVGSNQAEQAKRLSYMWEVMRRENLKPGDHFIGTGISMVTNWNFFATPLDTGLIDPIVPSEPPSSGQKRPAYYTWRTLQRTARQKVDTPLPPKPT